MNKVLVNTWKDTVGSKIIANILWEYRSSLIALVLGSLGSWIAIIIPLFAQYWYVPILVISLFLNFYFVISQVITQSKSCQIAEDSSLTWLKTQDLKKYWGLFWFPVHNTLHGVKTELDFVEHDPQFRKLLDNNVFKKIANHGYQINPCVYDYLKENYDRLSEQKRKEIEFELDGRFGETFLKNNISD